VEERVLERTTTAPTPTIERVAEAFDALKARYDGGINDFDGIGVVADRCLRLLASTGTALEFWWEEVFDGGKQYNVFKLEGRLSRPIRLSLFERDPRAFRELWGDWTAGLLAAGGGTYSHPETDRVLYTVAMAFAAAYDLHKPRSRKTPGTFFEVVIGSVLTRLGQAARTKQIPALDILAEDVGEAEATGRPTPARSGSVPTDILLEKGPSKLVVATKITSRERIVQVFVHQRILDGMFPGHYREIAVLCSETQRDDRNTRVNDICVPGQIQLYARYVAAIAGLYYLDVPAAYADARFSAQLPVRLVSRLLDSDLVALLG
jgi:hypothetical protein